MVLSALAELEDRRGHADLAINLELSALRYKYVTEEAQEITISHHNLGGYLRRRDRLHGLAHRLAAALIASLSGAAGGDESVDLAGLELNVIGDDAAVPASLTELCHWVGEVPGVELERLLAGITPDHDAAEQAFRQLVAHVRVLANDPPAVIRGCLAQWDPVIAAMLAANSNPEAPAVLDEALDEYQGSDTWGALVAVLRRFRGGEAGQEVLAGLSDIHATIATRFIRARSGRISIPADLWRWPRRSLLAILVFAASGDDKAADIARDSLEEMAEDPDLAPLAAVLGRVLDGERDPRLAGQAQDPVHHAVIETVLRHLGPG